MQIIIPLTGNGSRFKAAGYERLKPFIEVHGTPMIEWVCRMFPVASDKFTFICRQAHLDELEYMEPELRRIAPDGCILGVRDWDKKGPVNDVLRMADNIDGAEPVLVSYCDYYMQWDYDAFTKEAAKRRCEGAVPCYSGFHPNLLPQKNVYASCKVDANENLLEIREKFSWTSDKTQSSHSPGVYYFATGALMKTYFAKLVASDQDINGEYYASLPYNFMVEDGLNIWCPDNVTKFCQWGTPEDLEEYLYWVNIFQQQKEATA